jgi:uncharacterized protein (TIGR02246 family)
MKTVKTGILALAMATMTGVAVAGPVSADLGVQASNARLQVAINNSVDNQALQELYTRDAVIIPPSGQIISSTSDYSSYLTHYLRGRMADFEVKTVDLRTVGDVTYQSAVWMATVKSGNGRDGEIGGDMTNVLQRQPDGSWKIKFQKWN